MSRWTIKDGRGRLTRISALALAAVVALGAGGGTAGEADVLDVAVTRDGNGAHRFRVTVRHDDTGWDHFADRWEVVGPDGAVLATRVLMHPHENEQPFTRALGGIALPADIDHVIVRAHDSVHGLGGLESRVPLTH